jgi:hypothetical protein
VPVRVSCGQTPPWLELLSCICMITKAPNTPSLDLSMPAPFSSARYDCRAVCYFFLLQLLDAAVLWRLKAGIAPSSL